MKLKVFHLLPQIQWTPESQPGERHIWYRKHCEEVSNVERSKPSRSLQTPKPAKPARPRGKETSLKPFNYSKSQNSATFSQFYQELYFFPEVLCRLVYLYGGYQEQAICRTWIEASALRRAGFPECDLRVWPTAFGDRDAGYFEIMTNRKSHSSPEIYAVRLRQDQPAGRFTQQRHFISAPDLDSHFFVGLAFYPEALVVVEAALADDVIGFGEDGSSFLTFLSCGLVEIIPCSMTVVQSCRLPGPSPRFLLLCVDGTVYVKSRAGFELVKGVLRAEEKQNQNMTKADAKAKADGTHLFVFREMKIHAEHGISRGTITRWRLFFAFTQKLLVADLSCETNATRGDGDGTMDKAKDKWELVFKHAIPLTSSLLDSEILTRIPTLSAVTMPDSKGHLQRYVSVLAETQILSPASGQQERHSIPVLMLVSVLTLEVRHLVVRVSSEAWSAGAFNNHFWISAGPSGARRLILQADHLPRFLICELVDLVLFPDSLAFRVSDQVNVNASEDKTKPPPEPSTPLKLRGSRKRKDFGFGKEGFGGFGSGDSKTRKMDQDRNTENGNHKQKFQVRASGEAQYEALSACQKSFILKAIHPETVATLLTGSAGTGKTKVLNFFIDQCQDAVADIAEFRHSQLWTLLPSPRPFVPSVREEGDFAITSTTGVTALKLCAGRATTFHSWMGVKPDDTPETMVAQMKEKVRRRWERTNQLILDECSMLDLELFDKVNRVAQIVRGNNQLWGGIRLIFAGDFLQLAPVCKRPSPQSSKPQVRFCFESPLMNQFTVVELRQNFRQGGNRSFIAFLGRLRTGTESPQDLKAIRKQCIPPAQREAMLKARATSNYVFTEIFTENEEANKANLQELAKLVWRWNFKNKDKSKSKKTLHDYFEALRQGENNATVLYKDGKKHISYETEMINKVLHQLPFAVYTLVKRDDFLPSDEFDLDNLGEEGSENSTKRFKSKWGRDAKMSRFHQKYNMTTRKRMIEKWHALQAKEGLTPETFLCAIGAQVMLLKNLNVRRGLVNGRQGIVIDYSRPYDAKDCPESVDEHGLPVVRRFPKVRFPEYEGSPEVEEIIVPHCEEYWVENKLLAARIQLPLRLSYASTIYKVQGLTISGDALLHAQNLFGENMLYVAWSRVRTFHSLWLLGYRGHKHAHPVCLEWYRKQRREAETKTIQTQLQTQLQTQQTQLQT